MMRWNIRSIMSASAMAQLPSGVGLYDDPGAKQTLDLRLRDAGGAQHLHGVLADRRRERRRHFLLAVDLERTADRERSSRAWIVDRHQRAARAHLRVVRDVVERPDDAECHLGLLEDRIPV